MLNWMPSFILVQPDFEEWTICNEQRTVGDQAKLWIMPSVWLDYYSSAACEPHPLHDRHPPPDTMSSPM